MKRQLVIFVTASLLLAVAATIFIPQAVASLNAFAPQQLPAAETVFTLKPAGAVASESKALQLQDAQQVVTRRLELLALHGYSQVALHENQQQLQVTIPKGDNTPYVINVITHVGDVEFIDGGATPPIGQIVETEWNLEVTEPASAELYHTLFTGQHIDSIVPPNSDSGEIFYQIVLSPEAARRFEKFDAMGDDYICLVFDKEVTNCSKMYHHSGKTLDILPSMSSGLDLSLSDLAIFLDSGPLPAPLEVVD